MAYFLATRLFSLTGIAVAVAAIVLLGVQWRFLAEHGGTPPAMIPEAIFPGRTAILLLIPLAYHALWGLKVLNRGRTNVWSYPFATNFRYTLKRFCGVVGVATLIGALLLASGLVPLPFWISVAPAGFLPLNPSVMIVWTLGLAAAAYYFFSGLADAPASWGIVAVLPARRVLRRAGFLLFLAVLVVHLFIQAGFFFPAPRPAPFAWVMERVF